MNGNAARGTSVPALMSGTGVSTGSRVAPRGSRASAPKACRPLRAMRPAHGLHRRSADHRLGQRGEHALAGESGRAARPSCAAWDHVLRPAREHREASRCSRHPAPPSATGGERKGDRPASRRGRAARASAGQTARVDGMRQGCAATRAASGPSARPAAQLAARSRVCSMTRSLRAVRTCGRVVRGPRDAGRRPAPPGRRDRARAGAGRVSQATSRAPVVVTRPASTAASRPSL